MEVAGQWRREWAGTAEYGKVTEGGVTRQVARAMEVLHASAPGARVRVLRAAYHATAGPGAPASSYLLHSSRRVISSGYNFIEPESSLTTPLEISSMPLESSAELEAQNENYKVTEPDDFEISEPSKWRGSSSINALRMPSEESSSTDNASIIDLDYNNKNIIRKQAEKFTPQTRNKRTSPISSVLDSPVTLSTLKYKSLLSGNDSWNNRRKSYSFEETPELDENCLMNVDAVNMESSTDSGICKSSEFVNPDSHNTETARYTERKTRIDDIREETFKDWLSKNRQNSYSNQSQSTKEHIIGIELDNSKITLQSAGKVSITLPTRTDNNNHDAKRAYTNEDYDKKTKKVEFCKTELHFAAESGTVNIIATDEKPPPSNDFRKKRSMFVPMNNNYNKSITLLGETSDILEAKKNSPITDDFIDESTAATKSILKNKIPKPKPYLLGENMVFGDSLDINSGDVKNEVNNNFPIPSSVSLINRHKKSQNKPNSDSRSSIESEIDWNSITNSSTRATKISPVVFTKSNQEIEQRLPSIQQTEKDVSDLIKRKVKMLHMSPTPPRARTRELRESDLTYFGVINNDVTQTRRKDSLDSSCGESNKDEILHSVQLVKLISNSVCNSEVDSDEAPDYENLPNTYNVTSKPTLRSHSKYQNYFDGNINKDQKILNPILERDDDIIVVDSRRTKWKKHAATPSSRSLSAPPKVNRRKSMETSIKANIRTNHTKDSLSSRNTAGTLATSQKNKNQETSVPERKTPESPLYVNFRKKETKKIPDNNYSSNREHSQSIERQKQENRCRASNIDSSNSQRVTSKSKSNCNSRLTEKGTDFKKSKNEGCDFERKKDSAHRTKVLVTPEKSPRKCREASASRAEKSSFKDKHELSTPTQKHRSSKTESLDCTKDSQSDRDKEFKASSLSKKSKASVSRKHCPKLSVDTTSTQKSVKEQHIVHTNDKAATEIIMPQGKLHMVEKVDKAEKKTRRSKYVINYDDKNGTVSSICKIKPDEGSNKKKRIVNYDNKENIKSHTLKKNNIPNKTDLLQLPDQQRLLYGKSKTKSKIRVHPSCHIL